MNITFQLLRLAILASRPGEALPDAEATPASSSDANPVDVGVTPADNRSTGTNPSTPDTWWQRRRARLERRKAAGRSFTLLPGAFYSQETRLGFAAFGNATFPLPGIGEDTWPSSIAAAAVYTLNHQASLALWPRFYFGESNTWAIESQAVIEHFPMNYFGIGPTSNENYQVYTRRRFWAEVGPKRRVWRKLYVGPTFYFSAARIVEHSEPQDADGSPVPITDMSQPLGEGDVSGEDGSRIAGAFASVRWDSRDNPQSTRSGTFVEWSIGGFPNFLANTHAFLQSRLDARQFFTFRTRTTLGGQLVAEWRNGDVPFTSMGELGGDHLLRGLYQGRFRDHSLFAAQLEVRQHVWKGLGLALFGGTGQVFRRPAQIWKYAPTYSVGGGLRYEVDQKSHTTIRLDVGGGHDGFGITFTFGEAF